MAWNGRKELKTSIHVQLSAPTPSTLVYAVSSSISRITTTSTTPFDFWIRLRRQPSFQADLKIRWYRKFKSPAIGIEGGDIEKLMEYANSVWSSRKPSLDAFQFLTNWTSSAEDFITSMTPARTGNYTVRVTDHAGTVFFSKTFELIVISRVGLVDVEISAFDPGSSAITTGFDSVLLEKSTDRIATVEVNRTYIIVCQFLGNPISPGNASIIRNKFDCPPMPISSNSTAEIFGNGCNDFTGFGDVHLLPVRYGDDGIIMSALVNFSASMLYGCAYNHTSGM